METTPSFSNYLDMDTALAYAHKTDSRINENSKQIFEIKDELTAMKNEHSRNKRAHEHDVEEIWAILKNAAKLSEETKLINKENAERMKETDKRMNQLFNKIDKENEKIFRMIEENNKQIEKNNKKTEEDNKRADRIDKQIEENNKQIDRIFKMSEKNEKMIEELGKQIKETVKETDRTIKELSTRFNSTVGNIMEGLMRPSSFKIFKKAGFSINRCLRNMKRKNKEPLLAMELDALMIGDTEIIALEVKSSCDCNDIDKFLFHMERFRTLFSEYDKLNLKVYVAIASLNYENEADLYAQKQGLLVIRVSEEEIFTLDPFDDQNLRIF